MWRDLNKENKKKYKTLITNFASLSEAFSQKEDDSNKVDKVNVAPIINSKFQETVFQKSFGAIGEDISNTSYDASLKFDNQKYLVGIKSFGIHSGDQKIAQFKSNSVSDNWEGILRAVKKNADSVSTQKEADELNEKLYKELAIKISVLRNARIASSKEQIRGFNAESAVGIGAVYHVLMSSKKGEQPRIFVGETEYSPIDIANLKINGSTKKSNPTNFKFTDGKHQYKYTSADSQLYMTFNNKNIIVDTWNINYVKDPFFLFENLHNLIGKEIVADRKAEVEDSVSWMIANKDGEVEASSGYNAFDGASKLAKKNNYRENRIEKIKTKYEKSISEKESKYIISQLKFILLSDWRTAEAKRQMKNIRKQLMNYVELLNNPDLLKDIESMVYRPVSEMYIPIPDSYKFHSNKPDFFGKNVGLFKDKTAKLLLPANERTFKLEFLSSGDVISAYINQDQGKGIQSHGNQQILGEWILRGVFQLEPREPLTGKRLNEIGINAIRLSKFKHHDRGIGLEFIWMDPENPFEDAIGWVSK